MKNRFQFGKNWLEFLKNINDDIITNSQNSMHKILETSLEGKTFLDVGSGSGLSSLSEKKSGAIVTSYDYDKNSVKCTLELKRRYYNDSSDWIISEGSILDKEFCEKLGEFDVVYSWGVLHHTGDMNKAFENIDLCVKKGGILFIAIYNDQGLQSNLWVKIKKAYVDFKLLRPALILFGYLIFWLPFFLIDLLKLKPFKKWKEYKKERGMSPHHDIVDWMGGYPFEVAKPEDVIYFYLNKGYKLKGLKTCGGMLGCNEFVFIKE